MLSPPRTQYGATGTFVLFTIGVTGLSVVITWIFNNSGGSVLLAVLAHAAFDGTPFAFDALFPKDRVRALDTFADVAYAAGDGGLALLKY